MDFRKAQCAYHPTELITNFCSEKQCLLPLCPSCISGHTQSHIEKGNLPKFQSINEIIRRVQSSMDDQSESFLEFKSRLVELASRKQNFKKEIVNKLEETKRMVISKVEERFEQLIKESLASMATNEKELGVNSNEKINDSYQMANSQFNTLHQLRANLRTDKYLTFLIKYLSSEAGIIKNNLEIVQKQVKCSEQCQTLIQINQNICVDIQDLISKSVRVNFVVPTNQPKLTRPQSVQSLSSQTNRQMIPRQIDYQRPIRRSIEPSQAVIHPLQPVRVLQPQGIRPTLHHRPSSSQGRDFYPQSHLTQTLPNFSSKDAALSTITNRMLSSTNKSRDKKGITLQRTFNELSFT